MNPGRSRKVVRGGGLLLEKEAGGRREAFKGDRITASLDITMMLAKTNPPPSGAKYRADEEDRYWQWTAGPRLTTGQDYK